MHQSNNLPLFQVRGSERIDFKRCQLKWYWHWKLGLTPRSKTFGALDLGTWVHETLATWYRVPKRKPKYLPEIMASVIKEAFYAAEQQDAPAEVLEGAQELAALAMGMITHYGKAYGRDPGLDIIGVEVPLEYTFYVDDVPGANGIVAVIHKLKPDAVARLKGFDGVFLIETKTAATVRYQHIAIDDQARPYMTLAQHCLREQGIIGPNEQVRGILYNWLRKAMPDERPRNGEGFYLNKNGTVSAKQPPPYFKREPFTMSRRAKAHVWERLNREVETLARMTGALRLVPNAWERLDKTPHHSCPKFCEYFAMCALHDEGADISAMMNSMYSRRNSYEYDEESTTDERPTFELG